MVNKSVDEAYILGLLSHIADPEIHVISITELGIVRGVSIEGEHQEVCRILITPTYTGCPAMRLIEDEIKAALAPLGFESVQVKLVYSPAWSTDALSAATQEKLRKYGIAPPRKEVVCPQCGSKAVSKVSEFGSTACKALYTCNECKEPFDYFKCI